MQNSDQLIRKKRPSFPYRLNVFAFFTLNLFAIINIILLIFNIVNLEQDAQQLYTSVSIYVLIFWCFTEIIVFRKQLNFLYLIPDAIFILIGLLVPNSERVFQFYLLGRQTYLVIKKQALPRRDGKFLETLSDNPPILVLYSFLFAIFAGSLLLMLPAATVDGKETTLLGAFFTSTSATCVTGLIVYDTGTHFTLFGQVIILMLMQVGGLGIMTISSAFAIMLGQKLTLKSESMIQNVVGESNKLDMINLVKNILLVTIIFELLGAIMLYFTFLENLYDPAKAVFHGIFHSVSAFCNAGFSLYQDSFMGFYSNINVNFVITSLIIIGGIGFPVLVDIRKAFSNKFKLSRFSLHSKIVLVSTLVLLILGTIAFFVAEYHNEMQGMNFKDRLSVSYFQSVTTRTAGFNTIDNSNLSKSSVFTSIILMFIGASPGSTGGGVKTTTVVVILISVLSMFRGNRDVNVFKRKVSNEIIKRVMALIAVSVSALSIMIFLLLLIEPFEFDRIVFEAFSAFGTVGLSMGITPLLSNMGKMIIILLMYFGRVGPLTLIFALSAKMAKSNFTYTEEKISIG